MGGGVSPRATRDAVRQTLEFHLTSGRCAYCGARASPERPLTREHLVPRSKGGRRHDHRIIVPACARCNRRRGCQDLILFLLARPCRISALLDHFCSLAPEAVGHVEAQVFAELYAALWVLEECAAGGAEVEARLKRLRSGRTPHRRRYAARRIVGRAGERLARARERGRVPVGPSCLVPDTGSDMIALALGLAEPLAVARARLLTLLSLAWGSPAEEVDTELRTARERVPANRADVEADEEAREAGPPRRRKRRFRVDRREGRGRRSGRNGLFGRRAA
jgi:hypothetical protein